MSQCLCFGETTLASVKHQTLLRLSVWTVFWKYKISSEFEIGIKVKLGGYRTIPYSALKLSYYCPMRKRLD